MTFRAMSIMKVRSVVRVTPVPSNDSDVSTLTTLTRDIRPEVYPTQVDVGTGDESFLGVSVDESEEEDYGGC